MAIAGPPRLPPPQAAESPLLKNGHPAHVFTDDDRRKAAAVTKRDPAREARPLRAAAPQPGDGADVRQGRGASTAPRREAVTPARAGEGSRLGRTRLRGEAMTRGFRIATRASLAMTGQRPESTTGPAARANRRGRDRPGTSQHLGCSPAKSRERCRVLGKLAPLNKRAAVELQGRERGSAPPRIPRARERRVGRAVTLDG
jgi:hypothetical protein